ncbi:unnamed protein product [Boreogadus saida]
MPPPPPPHTHFKPPPPPPPEAPPALDSQPAQGSVLLREAASMHGGTMVTAWKTHGLTASSGLQLEGGGPRLSRKWTTVTTVTTASRTIPSPRPGSASHSPKSTKAWRPAFVAVVAEREQTGRTGPPPGGEGGLHSLWRRRPSRHRPGRASSVVPDRFAASSPPPS